MGINMLPTLVRTRWCSAVGAKKGASGGRLRNEREHNGMHLHTRCGGETTCAPRRVGAMV